MSTRYDVCIVGAGVAGAAMAAYLGVHGKRVVVIEKNLSERDVIIGELLQPGGVEILSDLGLSLMLEGFDAQPIEGYALFMNGDSFQISYPSHGDVKYSGRGFRNGKFVQRMREYLRTLPSVTLIEGTVTALLENDERVHGVKYHAKGAEETFNIQAALTIVCDGMFSGFREKLSENNKKVSSYFLGLLLKDCDLPVKNHGHVIIANPSPCLIYPISGTETRMLIDFPWSEAPRKSPELIKYLNETIAPQLPPSVLPAFYNAVNEGKFKVMPNHLIPARPILKKGVVLLGDSLNMRHPLTGGGMTAALTDVKYLGNKLVSITDFHRHEVLTQAISEFYGQRHQNNATINILADALYGVMKNEDLKQACYNYLKRGGTYAEEPVSILSAISRDTGLLLKHFFAVAFYGITTMKNKSHPKAYFVRSKQMLSNAISIVWPLLQNEKPKSLIRAIVWPVKRAA